MTKIITLIFLLCLGRAGAKELFIDGEKVTEAEWNGYQIGRIAGAETEKQYNKKVLNGWYEPGLADGVDGVVNAPTSQLAEAKSREQRSLPYQSINSTRTADIYYFASKEWTVIKGSETYTLDEFVKSGKFCEWNLAHIYSIYIDTNCPKGVCCGFCGKCAHERLP